MTSDLSKMHDLAVTAVEHKWGRNAKRQLGETLYEGVLAREVVLLLLGQVLDEYAPAQDLVRTGMNWGRHAK